MKESTLMVKGLTRAQANALAVLFENGTMGVLISKEIKKQGNHDDVLSVTSADVQYDERPYNVNHEVFY